MDCKKFEFTASAYLDGESNEHEAREYREHLSFCPLCRERLAETAQVSFMVKTSPLPAIPRGLHRDIMKAVEQGATSQASLRQRAFEWVLRLDPRPLAYVTGVVASMLLFAFVLSGTRPIPTSQYAPVQALVFPVVTGSEGEFKSYNDLAANPGQAGKDDYYQLPRVLNNSALVSFSQIAYQKPGSSGMAALVEVSPDGHAEIVDVLDEQSDPYLVEQLWWSLGKPTFQPALVEGRPVSTRIVLLVEKVDVSG
ncbi:MAG TPA: zf-HC2 domain-containing protein [Blastocatellia bacterium]|nr:zf-HC2 domain-containing protein [Blastocatellia bacterium]